MVNWRQLLICLPALLAVTSLPLLAVAGVGGDRPLVICLDPQGGFCFHLGVGDHLCADEADHAHAHGVRTSEPAHGEHCGCCRPDHAHDHDHGHPHPHPQPDPTDEPGPASVPVDDDTPVSDTPADDFTDLPVSVDTANDDPVMPAVARIERPAATAWLAVPDDTRGRPSPAARRARERAPPGWSPDELASLSTVVLLT